MRAPPPFVRKLACAAALLLCACSGQSFSDAGSIEDAAMSDAGFAADAAEDASVVDAAAPDAEVDAGFAAARVIRVRSLVPGGGLSENGSRRVIGHIAPASSGSASNAERTVRSSVGATR